MLTNPRKSRRQFIASTALGAGTMVWTSTPARSQEDRLQVAVIGTGGQGQGHVKRFSALPGVTLKYVCDPDKGRRRQAAKVSGAKPVSDLREILDDPNIDAISIATPDHWHAPAAILACEAGKHVYVEKPCCHNFREGQLLVEAAKKNKRVVQHGTQQRSSSFTANAIQILKEGTIGEVLVAKAWNVQRRKDIGYSKPSTPPEGFDYDMWLGPAPKIPFQENRHHYN